jgi:Holliday junction DNA helicase RuvB
MTEMPMPDDINNEKRDMADAGPPTLNHVVTGAANASVKERICIALEAAFATGEPVAHLLLSGPPGTGKTMWANLIARENGLDKPITVLGQTIGSPQSLNGILLGLDEKAILFIDECHTLSVDCQNTLLRSMESREIYLEGGGASRKPKVLKVAPHTVIGATTDPHLLISPLTERFRLHLTLSPYGNDEVRAMVEQRAQAMGWLLEEDVALAVACRSRGTPRIALRLLEAVRRVSLSRGHPIFSLNDAMDAFNLEGLDAIGLSKIDRDYLSVLHDAGRPVRLNVIATRLQMPAASVSKLIENHLIREGYVLKDDGGRMLTERGLEYVRPLFD